MSAGPFDGGKERTFPVLGISTIDVPVALLRKKLNGSPLMEVTHRMK